MRIQLPRYGVVGAAVIDRIVLAAGAVALALGSLAAYEWLLLVLLARPMLAFVLVMSELSIPNAASAASLRALA